MQSTMFKILALVLLLTVSIVHADDVGQCPAPAPTAKIMCCIQPCNSYARPIWDGTCKINVRGTSGYCPSWFPFKCTQPVQCCGVQCQEHASCDMSTGKCACDPGYYLVGSGQLIADPNGGGTPNVALQHALCKKDTPKCTSNANCGINQYCDELSGQCKCNAGYQILYGNCVIFKLVSSNELVCNSPYNVFNGNACDCMNGYKDSGAAGSYCCPADTTVQDGICKCHPNAKCFGSNCEFKNDLWQFNSVLSEKSGCLDCKCIMQTTTITTTTTRTTVSRTSWTYTGSSSSQTFTTETVTSETTQTETVTISTVSATFSTTTASATSSSSTSATTATSSTSSETTETTSTSSITVTTVTSDTTVSSSTMTFQTAKLSETVYSIVITLVGDGGVGTLPEGVLNLLGVAVKEIVVETTALTLEEIEQVTFVPKATRARRDGEEMDAVVQLQRTVPAAKARLAESQVSQEASKKSAETEINILGRRWSVENVGMLEQNINDITTTPNGMTKASTADGSSDNTATIAGIVCGVIAIILIVIGVVFYRKWKANQPGKIPTFPNTIGERARQRQSGRKAASTTPVHQNALFVDNNKYDSEAVQYESKETGVKYSIPQVEESTVDTAQSGEYLGIVDNGNDNEHNGHVQTAEPVVKPRVAPPKPPVVVPPKPPVVLPPKPPVAPPVAAPKPNKNQTWEIGVASRKEAEAILLAQANPQPGHFVVRRSDTKPHPVLTILLVPAQSKFEHHVLQRDPHTGCFAPNGVPLRLECSTLSSLVDYLQQEADGINVPLRLPDLQSNA
eukprot:m.27835 g.27835  ORF g.27835 m.27835 type:complete len:794 (-) comp7942_c0_seq1:236-2617(-)